MSEKIGKSLSVEQTQYLKKLKVSVKELVKDIADFRADYEKNGPMVGNRSKRECSKIVPVKTVEWMESSTVIVKE